MTSKPRTLEELERDAAEDADPAAPARARASFIRLQDLERYDHIFSPDEAEAVKDCLRRLAGPRRRARALVAAGWRDLLTAAYQYEERQVPLKKERIGRAINTLRKRYGDDSLAVRIVRGRGLPRGRPRGGKADRDLYVDLVCRVYERISGRRAALTWDPIRSKYRGPLFDLLRAALAPAAFHEKGRPLSDGALASAVKRMRRKIHAT